MYERGSDGTDYEAECSSRPHETGLAYIPRQRDRHHERDHKDTHGRKECSIKNGHLSGAGSAHKNACDNDARDYREENDRAVHLVYLAVIAHGVAHDYEKDRGDDKQREEHGIDDNENLTEIRLILHARNDREHPCGDIG